MQLLKFQFTIKQFFIFVAYAAIFLACFKLGHQDAYWQGYHRDAYAGLTNSASIDEWPYLKHASDNERDIRALERQLQPLPETLTHETQTAQTTQVAVPQTP